MPTFIRIEKAKTVFCMRIPITIIHLMLIASLAVATLNNSTAQEAKIDSLEKELRNNANLEDSVRLIILQRLFREYRLTNPDKALESAQKAYDLAAASFNQLNMATSLNNMGVIHKDLGNYEKAIAQYRRALQLFKLRKDKKNISSTYSNIGATYKRKGDYELAIENYIQSLKLKEEILEAGPDFNVKKGVANTLNNMGIVYERQGRLEKAFEMYEKALQIARELSAEDPGSLVAKQLEWLTVTRLGSFYFTTKDYPAAHKYFLDALKISKETGDKHHIAYSLNNIGGVYYYQDNHGMAIENFYKAYKILEELNDKMGMSGCLLNIGELYSIMEYEDKAIDFTERGLAVAQEIGSKHGIKTAYQSLALLYEKKEEFEKAYQYHLKYSSIKDSIFSEKSDQKISQLQTIYETEKKEKELELANKDNMIKESELGRQKVVIWTGAAGLAMVMALAFFIYKGYRLKQKANTKLTEQNEQISMQKEELAKLSVVAEKTDSGVVIADAEGQLEWVNDGFTRLTGYGFEEFKEVYGDNLRTISSNEEIDNVLSALSRGHRSYSYDSTHLTKGGETKWTSSTLTPVFDEGGQLRKIVSVYSDITELKEAEASIREKSQEITDSIRYAERIQAGIMPHDDEIARLLPNSFVLFKPKDIVSGDFYWLAEKDDKVLYVAADCTGHGVPGAFMSMIGTSLLNELINDKGITNPAEIFHGVRAGIISALKQTGELGQQKDGMDAILVALSKNGKNHFSHLECALANNPLFIIREGKKPLTDNGKELEPILEEGDQFMYVIKQDKQPVGYQGAEQEPYTHHEVALEKGDMVYAISDGYQDQFGGHKGKKFMIKRQKHLFMEIQSEPLAKQKQLLEETLHEWMNHPDQPNPPAEQVDDILIIGVKI